MDFLSNLIKRPNSISLPEPNLVAEADAKNPEREVDPDSSSSSSKTVISSRNLSPSPNSLITLAMNRCSIDTDLENLFDSAAQELNSLEQQHNNLIEHEDAVPVLCPEPSDNPSCARETIKQLLNEINFNLDQVTAREMEHLQAMSLELSPLAVKPSTTRHSLEQQKALVAAMRSTPQPDTPNRGLPEFDETQIPELASLSAEMEAELKTDVCAPTLSSTSAKLGEHDYNSDSDVYAECLSLNSVKILADQSELEAYSSALNEVLEQQLSNATATTLDNTLSEASTALNDSCEPMDVDEINETMEMLKDVLAPEDHQLLQQQFLEGAIQQIQNQQLHQMAKQQEQHEVDNLQQPKQEQTMQLEESVPQLDPISVTPPLSVQPIHQIVEQSVQTASDPDTQNLSKIENKPTQNNQSESIEQSAPAAPLPAVQTPPKAVSPVTSAIPQIENQLLEESEPESASVPKSHIIQNTPVLPLSPPIPTHRTKTAEELEELMALQAYAQPDHADTIDIEDDLQSTKAIPIAAIVPKPKLFPTLEVNISDSSQGPCSAPTSPSFPIKSPEESPKHFPRSPRAPAEPEEMQYLERAIIEPSVDQQQCLSGVIAKLPLPIHLTVTAPSPEKPQQEQQLNTTMPLSGGSPLNGTFDNVSSELPEEAVESSSRRTFGVPLDTSVERQRRTFSVITDHPDEHEQEKPNRHSDSEAFHINQEDNHLNATYGMPLHAAPAEQQRTYSVQDTQKTEQPSMRKTFNIQQDASPAMEATEENIMGNEFEAMDIDMSLRVDTNLEQPTQCNDFVAQLAEAQAVALPPSPSPTLPVQQHVQQQQQLELEHRSSPPLPAQLKRPSIHSDMPANTTVVVEEQKLSVKELLSAGNEKDDVYVEHFGAMSPISDELFKQPQCISTFTKGSRKSSVPASVPEEEQFHDAEFQDGASNNNSSNNAPVDRSSLLLKFDPLLGAPVPVNQLPQQEQSLLNILSNNNNNIIRALSPTLEEHETSGSNHSFASESSAKSAAGPQKEFKPPVDRSKVSCKHAKMSVDVIDNDCNKTFENSSLNSEEKAHKYHDMDELEKKIKNEVTRSEDIEKKLKEAEQREEALVKRITEKDKTNAKLNGVIEAYEKAIAELIHDKEQLVQNHERQMQEVQADRDANYHHLTSLETTFSDLHVKYEKSKEMTAHLKQIEENLLEEKKKSMDKLRQQEQRYEQMKSHAMQQMEIANKKLAILTKEHTDEMKKLKALLKKEEVSRISTAEQLQQKSRENADLLKICEELIYDKGQGGSS
ncbi:putative mediator of RNA polymerase II transcription subunit 26 isoform X3 [Drosophila hydei]|uniref:Mediator of RNA polymerase II transcription subunit 26 isoform X3 n=1 Tax=Drosophila hydei TaxID=7224 RepID=A0A6J1ME58_DROHY|nr:putative mediator of RNA polymerase II transcription subunit 26 isoform X3 [Drosophila hydei]